MTDMKRKSTLAEGFDGDNGIPHMPAQDAHAMRGMIQELLKEYRKHDKVVDAAGITKKLIGQYTKISLMHLSQGLAPKFVNQQIEGGKIIIPQLVREELLKEEF